MAVKLWAEALGSSKATCVRRLLPRLPVSSGACGGPYYLTWGPLLKVSDLGESKSVPKKEAAVASSPTSDVTSLHFFCVPSDERET